MKNGLVILALVLALPSVAGTLTFSEAKAKADSMESNLSSRSTHRLINAQQQLASNAFSTCVQSTNLKITGFTVVAQVNMQGAVVNTWRKGESEFAQCFQEAMVTSFSYKPETAPFFTSFEYIAEH